jgi:hypothetical protein
VRKEQALLTIESRKELVHLDQYETHIKYFRKNQYTTVIADYSKGNSNESELALLPEYARQLLTMLLDVKIAEDFQILSPSSIDSQNAELPVGNDTLSLHWLVFAYSGQGDFWLLHKKQNEIGFYDHNKENYALNSADNIYMNLQDWLVVGDLYRQFDLLNETDPTAFNRDYTLKAPSKEYFISQIDSVRKNLFKRLPFTNT